VFGSAQMIGEEAKVSDVEISYFFCCFFLVPFCLIGLPRLGDAFLVSLKAAFPDCIPFPCLVAIVASCVQFCCIAVAGYFDLSGLKICWPEFSFVTRRLLECLWLPPDFCFFGWLWVRA